MMQNSYFLQSNIAFKIIADNSFGFPLERTRSIPLKYIWFVPVSAMPMLRMGALCFCGKSSEDALKDNVPSSFLIILKIRIVSPLDNQVINALQRKRREL